MGLLFFMPDIYLIIQNLDNSVKKYKISSKNEKISFARSLLAKGMFLNLLIGFCVSFVFISSSFASSQQPSPSEIVPEKYQEVLNKAKTGDVNAQMKLGLLYYSGVGLEKNYQSALHWFKIAAEKGHPGANYMLGKIFLSGIGVKTDIPLAVQYLEKASENGDSSAQAILGQLYYEGTGIEKDYEKAAFFFRKSAENKNANGQFGLANLYKQGLGWLKIMEKPNVILSLLLQWATKTHNLTLV